ncbi:MAG: hypothetical protein CM15mP74_12340 [Halieaceae bacterium]|nr:MAG: hypothetical protein CM15mP74_12340 [Halieaceae bacterium]
MTFGVVYTPTFGDFAMELTVDYWDLELEDGITSLGVNYTLNDCYENQNQGACALITDVPITASLKFWMPRLTPPCWSHRVWMSALMQLIIARLDHPRKCALEPFSGLRAKVVSRRRSL